MQRLVAVIAVVFALAAALGVATNHAMAYSSVAVAAPTDVAACSEGDTAVVVSFKSCGKKRSGIVMPCSQHAGVLPQACALAPDVAHARFALVPATPIASQPVGQRLRPPIAA